MDEIREHFEKEAREFDRNFFKVAPYYKEAIGALISALSFKETEKIKVVDLGCGTGNITKALLDKYPKASVVCVDLAEGMIKMARAKLKKYKNVEYRVGNIADEDFSGRYDAVISSLVLHHIEKKDKPKFYKKIYNGMSRGGVFYTADFVIPPGDYLKTMYVDHWKAFMAKNLSPTQIISVLDKHKREDRPAELMFELETLKKTGFKNIEVVWKKYNFAIYGAEK